MTTAEEFLHAGEWEAAREAFRAMLDVEETAAAQEGLARASRALDDHATATAALERAYRLHVEGGSGPEAARVASVLADLAISNTGDAAVASGWLLRARHHLRDHPDNPEWPLVVVMQAYIKLAYDKDAAAARVLANEAHELAQRLDDTTAEVIAKAHLGLVRVSEGEVAEGMQLLDEATAAAAGGEVPVEVALDTYCVLITACERVRDYHRVRQWANAVMDQATGPNVEDFMTFARTEYAHVLARTGELDEAERQLRIITDDRDARPLAAAMAWVHLADVQLARGDVEQADRTLAIAEREPFRRGVRHLAMAERAAILLAQGDAQAAADMAQRHLRAVSPSARVERVGVLETLVRASAVLGDRPSAKHALAELEAIAGAIATNGIRAAGLASAAHVAELDDDLERAIENLVDALELYEDAGMTPSVVATRVELARLHRAHGDVARATAEADRARAEAEDLGAAGAAVAATAVLDGLREPGDGGPAELTRREVEVLRLVADGLSNTDIAERLVLSVRTVERHLSNIYLKIGATGPSARSTATTYAHRHGLV
ncbi:MAG: LuxR C-terminal-related transcriptional regulator [Nitriliruptorales bacterium]|nr:LuxR C-terminal-related transcriptional regulator [Nitriliruptorales bacterium]